MLDEIRLTGEHLKLLQHAAELVGAQLDPDYLGDFRPAASPRCVALRCVSPGQLMHFGALVAMAFALPDHLMLTMAARVQEDGPDPAGTRAYYWPGILGPARVLGPGALSFERDPGLDDEPGPGYWEKGDY